MSIDLTKVPKLGFGLMRLPEKDGVIDHEQLCHMVDKMLTSTLVSMTTPKMSVKCGYQKRMASDGQMLPSEVEARVTASGLDKGTKLTLSKITLNKVQKTPFEMPGGLKKL